MGGILLVLLDIDSWCTLNSSTYLSPIGQNVITDIVVEFLLSFVLADNKGSSVILVNLWHRTGTNSITSWHTSDPTHKFWDEGSKAAR
jgi:hypothetical protein